MKLYFLLAAVTVYASPLPAQENPKQSSVSSSMQNDIVFSTKTNTAAVVFNVTDGTVGFEVEFFGSRAKSFSIQSLKDPAGHSVIGALSRPPKYYNGPKVGEARFAENPVNDSIVPGTVSVMIPNNPITKPLAGQWHLVIKCNGKTSCASEKGSAVIVTKKFTSNFETATGVLPIRLHFAGTSRWNADSLKSDASFQQFLHRLQQIYQSIGVKVDVISSDDIKNPKLTTINDGLNLSQKISSTDAIDLFFVKAENEWTGILGISLVLPGPVRAPVGRSQGIVVVAEDSSISLADQRLAGPESIAIIAAHEMGHFLGLFHVCELDDVGTFTGLKDPMTDTTCDRKFLMAPEYGRDVISREEANVILRNPIVKLNADGASI